MGFVGKNRISTQNNYRRFFPQNTSVLQKDGAKQRKVIPPNIMEAACKEVVDGLSTVRASATKFDIDRMTLTRYIAKYRLNPRDTHNLQSNYKKRPIFY